MKKLLFLFALMLVCSIGMSQSPTHCDCEDVEGIEEWFATIDPDAECATSILTWTLTDQWTDEDAVQWSSWEMSARIWNGQTFAVTVFCFTWWDGPWPHVGCRTVM